MRKAMGSTYLTIVLALVMFTVSGLSFGAPPPPIEITLDTTTMVITIDVKYRGLGTHPKFGTNKLEWRAKTVRPGWMVVIDDVPNHLRCFTTGIPTWEINPGPGNKNLDLDSGIPDASCTGDKYGVYWPYVVTFYQFTGQGKIEKPADLEDLETKGWQKKAWTDPGGIIHP